MHYYEMLIKRSRQAPEPPGPSIPTDYVFYAPLQNDINDHSASARTGSYYGDSTNVIVGDVKDNVKCTYLPVQCMVTWPVGDAATGHTSRTMSCWIYSPMSSSLWNSIMSYGTKAYYSMWVMGYYNKSSASGAYGNDIMTSNVLSSNAWHNTIYMYDASTDTMKLYLDGTLVGTKNTSQVSTVGADISVGGRYYSLSTGDDGKCESAWFAAARLYNRVLTDEEIALLANEDLTGDASDSSSSGGSDSSSSSGGSAPTDYVFRAPLATSLDDVSASARTATESGGSATVGEVKDGITCTYIPSAVKVKYPIGDVAIGSSPRTVSLWFWTPSIDSAWNTMFCYGTNSNHYYLYAMGYHQSGKYAFTAYYNDLDSGLGTATASTWHNFVTTYDGTAIKVYVDGVLKGSKTTANINTATSDIVIGGRTYSGESANSMWYADVRIYNRALTDAEIAAIASQIN